MHYIHRGGILVLILILSYTYAQDDPRTTYGGYAEISAPYTWNVEESSPLWSYELPANHPLSRHQRFNPTLVVDGENQRAFFLGDGFVQALDLTTGELLWKHQDDEAEQIAYSRGILVVKASQKENDVTVKSTVYRFETTTQSELWRVDAPITYYGLAIANHQLLLAFSERLELVSYDLQTGQERWRLKNDYGVDAFTVTKVIEDVLIAETLESGAITTGGLMVVKLDTGEMLWQDSGIGHYLGHDETTLYFLSDEFVGDYSTLHRPGVMVVRIYDLYKGYKDRKIYDVNSEFCYEADCPRVQFVTRVGFDDGFIYAGTPYSGVLRFDLTSNDTFEHEQVGMSGEYWLTGPYRGQLFEGDERALIIRDMQDMIMGGWVTLQ